MRRNFRLFILLTAISISFIACGKEEEEEIVETGDTTEQVAFDDVEVEDYTVLKYNELEVLAYEDDTDAQVMLGRMLEYGTDDVKQDFTEAISWYQMASDSGNADGTCALGYFYLTGTGVDQDLDKAIELFDTAIEGGSVNALVGKGRAILAGLSDEELELASSPAVSSTETSSLDVDADNLEDADGSDSSASAASEDEADNMSEDNHNDTASISEESLEELTEKLETVYDLFYRAQISGDVDGAYYLGYAYEYGIGKKGDFKKAFDYYSRAAKTDSTDLADQYAKNKANTAIALLYINGNGVDADVEKAIEYLTVASS